MTEAERTMVLWDAYLKARLNEQKKKEEREKQHYKIICEDAERRFLDELDTRYEDAEDLPQEWTDDV